MSRNSSSSNSSDDDDDYEEDPRIAAMFQGVSEDGAAAVHNNNNNERIRRSVQITESAIQECFQRALSNHGQVIDSGTVVGIWKAPPIFQMAENDKDGLTRWQPASLPLPSWVVQPPNELESLQKG